MDDFFLESLEAMVRKLERKYAHYKSKGPYLNERQKQVLAYIKANEPVKIGDVAGFMSEVSKNTIKKDVQYLLQEGAIEKIGKGRGTVYVLSPGGRGEE